MKKLLYFTISQAEVLDKLKIKCKMNNSEIVRSALKDYAIKYGINIPDFYEAIEYRGKK